MQVQHMLLSGPAAVSDLVFMVLVWIGLVFIIGLGIKKGIDFLKEKKQNNE